MIGFEEIREILSLYRKHGWKLSGVLLSEALRDSLPDKEFNRLFGDEMLTERSQIDAAWFVRPRKDDGIAWEIRLLSTKPFALCESFPESYSREQIEEEKKNMQNRLLELAS